MCHFNHKSVQLSEFVWITEAHSFTYSNRAVTYTVRMIEGLDNQDSDNQGPNCTVKTLTNSQIKCAIVISVFNNHHFVCR